MNTIQDIFNNREIAIGLWVIVAVILLLFTKAAREFLKTALPILFCESSITLIPIPDKDIIRLENYRPI